MAAELRVLNLEQATYECTFGRGCDGICCKNGRPAIHPIEHEVITENLARFLPEMRPEARRLAEREGIVSRRRRLGLPMLRVSGGWCVFFQQGCVLHRVGAAEGDKFRYKPSACSLFPLAVNKAGNWYVRQKGVEGEIWDLFCLDPANSARPASESLRDEIALAIQYSET